jgi:hypothetical protein
MKEYFFTAGIHYQIPPNRATENGAIFQPAQGFFYKRVIIKNSVVDCFGHRNLFSLTMKVLAGIIKPGDTNEIT